MPKVKPQDPHQGRSRFGTVGSSLFGNQRMVITGNDGKEYTVSADGTQISRKTETKTVGYNYTTDWNGNTLVDGKPIDMSDGTWTTKPEFGGDSKIYKTEDVPVWEDRGIVDSVYNIWKVQKEVEDKWSAEKIASGMGNAAIAADAAVRTGSWKSLLSMASQDNSPSKTVDRNSLLGTVAESVLGNVAKLGIPETPTPAATNIDPKTKYSLLGQGANLGADSTLGIAKPNPFDSSALSTNGSTNINTNQQTTEQETQLFKKRNTLLGKK